MQIGVTFPQTEIGADPKVVADYARAAESLGYDYLLAYDHVLGASTATRPDWQGPYTSESMFHEPFVLFGYLACAAPKLGLVTGVIVLPQRQTALVAKQAAQVDVLCGGRLRLGVGVGWNAVEYEGLGQAFSDRGKRADEQIALLRRLFCEPAVAFTGAHHVVSDAGINPLPVQRPIPIWIGGMSDAALRRAGRLGDGWFPMGRINDAMEREARPGPGHRGGGRPRPRRGRHRRPHRRPPGARGGVGRRGRPLGGRRRHPPGGLHDGPGPAGRAAHRRHRPLPGRARLPLTHPSRSGRHPPRR